MSLLTVCEWLYMSAQGTMPYEPNPTMQNDLAKPLIMLVCKSKKKKKKKQDSYTVWS